ncbi:MAG: 30S ribosomal protein S6--L-glutamate ligase [Acidobacteria bacterium]|nr:30S ribosomal protein S6--L-glutamate ligase [Acidobacteriota bacterium]
MRVLIMSRKRTLYSTNRLVEAGRERGHDVVVVDYLRCYMNITSRRPQVMYAGESITGVDAVIPRIGASYTFYGAAVVRQFEAMGVLCANESDPIARSRDKLKAMQILAQKGVGLPITSFAHSTKDVDSLIKVVGGTPLVIKLLEGTQGLGVVLAETNKAATSVIEAFRALDANILVQEFIAESEGADVRALVVGTKVVAAIRRQGAPGEFRSNLHRGGSAEPVLLTKKERRTAVEAVEALGLKVAGVDLLRSDRGPLVLEVNSSPGLEGIETASSIDVAAEIYAHLERRHAQRRRRKRRKRRRR